PLKATPLIVATDKFRGTITAAGLSNHLVGALSSAGIPSVAYPMSDGGEGFLECFSGERHFVELEGPMGRPIEVPYLLQEHGDGLIAIAESAHAIGRSLVQSPSPSLALELSSTPIGYLLLHLQQLDVQRIQLGIGGTATSDGGRGAATVLLRDGGLSVDLELAVDVGLPYARAVDFAVQKGVSATDLPKLELDLEATRRWLQTTTGIDPGPLVGAGAGGGLGGALLSLGASAVSGAAAAARGLHLDEALPNARGLITGEGLLDHTSLSGKVVGWLLDHSGDELPVAVVCGATTPEAHELLAGLGRPISLIDLSARYGLEESLKHPELVATDAVISLLKSGWFG
ncbi:MAG: glycerate kinase, partial [Actinomycetota bacterium]